MNNQTEDKRDDLRDRLMELALEEKLGGKRPPDFSANVLPKVHRPSRWASMSRLTRLTLAASVLLAIGLCVSWPAGSYLGLAQRDRAADKKTSAIDSSDSLRKLSVSRSETTRVPLSLGAQPDTTLHVWLDPTSAPSATRHPFITEALAGHNRREEGRGPEQRGDQHQLIVDNALRRVVDEPLSTLSIDVDTAAYSKLRSLLNSGEGISPDRFQWLRVEELINYFGYDYPALRTGEPFSVNIETAACPWAAGRRLVRIGLKGREIDRRERPAGNFVFLLDVSGSMEPPNKLPLVLEGMRLLVGQLTENDRVAIVVYAGASGLVLPSTPATHEGKQEILSALARLHSGGSTNGAAGIELAYQMAQDHFIKGGANRVILCTDGDFNVGVTSPDQLESLITEKAKTGVFLTTLGFGMGNHNDAMLEKLADKGNGVYGYIDTIDEAKKLFVEELSGTLVTVAKDVKIQVEFNPVQVAAYRLIGYENRVLAKEDFNDDKKDAGEIGAGHTVTALYEIVPAALLDKPAVAPNGDKAAVARMPPKVDDLEFQKPGEVTAAAKESGQTLVVKLRYKEPDGEVSKLIKVGVKDEGKDFSRASGDFKFAAAVASFGMLLRDSPYKGSATLDSVLEIARSALGEDRHGYRAEFVRLVERAKTLGR